MRMLFKQRLLSLLDSYDIYDEEENTLYVVKGKFAFGHKLVIYDNHEKEVGMVKQELISVFPKFSLYKDGSKLGVLKKEFSLINPKYNINYNGWHIEGDWLEWNYEIQDSKGKVIATITEEPIHLTDYYVIDVADPDDALMALMVVLAIDAEKDSADD